MVQICGYDWVAGKSKQVAYIAHDFKIYELSQVSGQSGPFPTTLPAPMGSVSSFTAISGFQWIAGNSKHVIYTDDGGHVHELTWSTSSTGWSHTDLFDGKHIADPPLAVSARPASLISGYDWPAASTKQIVYFGSDGPVYELTKYPNQALWGHANLTKLTGTESFPWEGLPICGYDWTAGQQKQVLLCALHNSAPDKIGHLHSLHVAKGASWYQTDIWGSANAPSTGWADHAGDAVGLGRGPGATNYVACRDSVNGLYLFVFHPSSPGSPIKAFWSYTNLGEFFPDTVGNLGRRIAGCDWISGGYRQIYFYTLNGHIHELYQPYNDKSGAWSHADLMKELPQAPLMFTAGAEDLVAYEWTAGASKQVVYPSADGNLHELFCTIKDGWLYRQLTGLTNGPPPAPAFD
jgi:hypothetical protein